MNLNKWLIVFSIFLSLTFIRCGEDVKKQTNNGIHLTSNQTRSITRLNWSKIPSKYNPKIEEEKFEFDQIKSIHLDMWGFDKDVEVTYSDKLKTGSGILKIYSVIKDTGSFGSQVIRPQEDKLNLKRTGIYQCSIKTTNGEITELNGGCYVRIQVFLPTDTEVEVYNMGDLISKRFFPMEWEVFMKKLDDASFKNQKFLVIDQLLQSYNNLNTELSISAKDLGEVLDEFNFKDEKIFILKRLKHAVDDPYNLNDMIDAQFNYFDRDDAKSALGL